ncbi:MAG: hypothetical protein IPM16_23985 [Chloroflexi bacterium]|nr:hypothetical protein [Chloroflexota bacterium]
MYKVIAGINPDPSAPGHKHTISAAPPGGGLTFARATLRPCMARWCLAGSSTAPDLEYDVTVPPNTTATVHLPVIDAL